MSEAYAEAVDAVSLREHAGQVATARRALRRIGRLVGPETLADIGCWTGSLLVAAGEMGWETWGVDPSRWAVARAQERGLRVWKGDLRDPTLRSRSFGVVTMCDVLEHLPDPVEAMHIARELVAPSGVLYMTLPDAGSVLARVMGRRWWSVLPMHLQYFTRQSLCRLVEHSGFAIASVRPHAKVFSARYYAERLGGYSPRLQRAVLAALEGVHQDQRLIGPNFHDRMEVIAVR